MFKCKGFAIKCKVLNSNVNGLYSILFFKIVYILTLKVKICSLFIVDSN